MPSTLYPCITVTHLFNDSWTVPADKSPGRTLGWWSIVTYDGECVGGGIISETAHIQWTNFCNFLSMIPVWTWITKGLCRLYTWLLCFSDNKWFAMMSIVACRGWKNALLLGLVSDLFSFSNYGDSGFDNKNSLIITQTLLDLMNVIWLKVCF